MSIVDSLSAHAPDVDPARCSHCLTNRCQQKRESWSTFASCSTASDIRGPGRTVGKIISILGRKLDKVVESMPENLTAMSEVPFFCLRVKVKVLLLGSADSGKSDIIEHVRSKCKGPDSVTQLASTRKLVYDHIRHEMLLLLEGLERSGGYLSEDNTFHAQHLKNANQIYHDKPFPTPLYAALSDLWDDPGIQTALEQWYRPSLTYFYSSLDRFFGANYVPTYRDITQVASAKGALPHTTLKVPDAEITFVDADLCKEPPHLSDIACILYVVNLAGYDKSLCLQYSATQMDHTMVIWNSICQSRWYQKTPLLLILNSSSRQFEDSHVEVSSSASDFNSTPNDALVVAWYMRKHFMKIAKRHQKLKRRKIFVHIGDPSFDSSSPFVLSKLKDIIFTTALYKIYG